MTQHRIKGHGPCWDHARSVGSFTYVEIAAATGKSYGAIVRLVRIWEQAGGVVADGLEGSRRVRFRVVNAEALQPVPGMMPLPRTGGPEANMWTVMRMLSTFGPTTKCTLF